MQMKMVTLRLTFHEIKTQIELELTYNFGLLGHHPDDSSGSSSDGFISRNNFIQFKPVVLIASVHTTLLIFTVPTLVIKYSHLKITPLGGCQVGMPLHSFRFARV
jgi:hypothetical protein